ncbi:hypothetical protein F5Y19DRAFT_124749 [Xylariaceae sp. FL1651]|nr:hypothetical protein F5Y19DRAFT_124749 [Xylariaceae sp. FL1651]
MKVNLCAHMEARAAASLRGGRTPRHNDVFIAVMGATGSGKSSFIQLCSAKPVKIGDALQSCTQEVSVYAYEQSPDRTVYLIDTPSFDNTGRSDTAVLRDVAAWLNDSYKDKILLSGVLYLHRISDMRMQGSAAMNLAMFRKLCGDESLNKVMLVTTRWDEVPEVTAVNREKQLMDVDKFGGYMVKRGSVMRRHYNTVFTARSIVDELAGAGGEVILAIQDEMVNQKRDLSQTSAGQEIQGEIAAEKAKWTAARAELERDMEEARREHDRQRMEDISRARDDVTRRMEQRELELYGLKVSQQKLHEERVQKLEQLPKQQEGTKVRLTSEKQAVKQGQESQERKQGAAETECEGHRQQQQAAELVFPSTPPPPYSQTRSPHQGLQFPVQFPVDPIPTGLSRTSISGGGANIGVSGVYSSPTASGIPNKGNNTRHDDGKGCSNCTGCHSCKNCSNCTNCNSCKNCSNSTNCNDCKNCSNCMDCDNCKDCSNCTNCNDCVNCSNCTDCSGLRNAHNLQGVHR